MNTRIVILTVVTVCLSLSGVERASAYYAADLGRFLSRDPLGERIGQETTIPNAGFRVIGRDLAPSIGHAGYGNLESLKRDSSATQQMLNLYQYTGGNPIIRVDPSGLFFGFSYGKYCGFLTRGPGVPDDSLDAACQRHDQCLATVGLFLNPITQACCNSKLCIEAKRAVQSDCKTDWPGDPVRQKECEGAAGFIAALACGLTGTSPVPGVVGPSRPPFPTSPYWLY